MSEENPQEAELSSYIRRYLNDYDEANNPDPAGTPVDTDNENAQEAELTDYLREYLNDK